MECCFRLDAVDETDLGARQHHELDSVVDVCVKLLQCRTGDLPQLVQREVTLAVRDQLGPGAVPPFPVLHSKIPGDQCAEQPMGSRRRHAQAFSGGLSAL